MRRPRTTRARAVALAVVLLTSGAAPPLADAITGTDANQTGTGGEEPQAATPPPDSPFVPISVTPEGVPADGDSSDPAVAGEDPAVTVFVSDDDDLTPDDGNGHRDVFVNDNGVIDRVSTDPPGFTATDVVAGPAVSSTGDPVVYGATLVEPPSEAPVDRVVVTDRETGATELAPPPRGGGDIGGVAVSPDGSVVAWEQDGDIYVHQPGSGATEPFLVSGGGRSSDPGLCSQGQRIVFATHNPLVVAGDTNGVSDIVAVTGVLTADPADDQVARISRSHDGGETDGASTEPAITPDCNKVVFTSFATNVVPGDTNATADVFVHDLTTATTTAVTHGNGPSGQGAISDDGGYVAFASAVDNLVADDTNGDDPRGATPTSFQAVDRSGQLTYATSVVSVDGSRVRMGFPDTLDFAAVSAGSVDAGAVIDHQILPVDIADGRSNTNSPATRGPTRLDDDGTPIEPGDDVTDAPDLFFAEVVLDDAGTPDDPEDDVSVVRYCFDETVGGIPTPSGRGGTEDVATDRFLLLGHNSAVRLRSTRATVERHDEADITIAAHGLTACVRASFPAGVEVPRFPGAAVLGGAVADGDGRLNVKGSTPLAGNVLDPGDGDVTGPNLRSAQTDLVANRVTYIFDDIAVTDPLLGDVASRFAFVDADGHLHTGRFVAAADGEAESVTVEFDVDADSVAAARRFVVLAGAVGNAAGETNVEQSTDGDVAGPELLAVTRVGPVDPPGPPVFDFVFSADVTGADLARFVLYTEDGTGFPVESLTRPSPRIVRVGAPAVGRFAESIVLGVAQPRAVVARLVEPDGGEVSGAPNPLGAKGIKGRHRPAGSVTDGPDLVGVELLPDLHAADFVFDEPVRDVHLLLTATAPRLPTDVFVRELATGDLVRASLDGEDRELPGTSSHPGISGDGRYVVFAYLPRLPDGNGERRVVVRRDLIAVGIRPATIDFGDLTAGEGRRETRRATVANHGFGRLVIGAVTLAGANPGDFTVTSDRCTGRILRPKQACVVAVAFAPASAGSRVGDLMVAYKAPRSPRLVSLRGQGLPPVRPVPPVPPATGPPGIPPTLLVAPELGPPGTVALVRGEGFLPGEPVQLRWASAPAAISVRSPLGREGTVVPDEAGKFGPIPMLVLPGDVLGPRLVEAQSDEPGVSATAPFLVVPGTVQPRATRMSTISPFGDVLWTLVVRRLQLVDRR